MQLFSYNLLYIQHKHVVLLQICGGGGRGFTSASCGKHIFFTLFVCFLRPGGFLYPYNVLLNQMGLAIHSSH